MTAAVEPVVAAVCLDGRAAQGVGCDGGAGSGGNGVKRVFVTSAAWDGDLNGLAGADEKCEEAAIAAELGGNWVAWLSVSNQPAADRLKDVGPWYRVNGTELVVEDKEDLLEMGPSVPIEYSELGTLPLEPGVWTGTRDSGAGSEMNCQDWNTSVASEGLYGNWQQVTHWSGFVFFAPCSTKMSLYCFEQ